MYTSFEKSIGTLEAKLVPLFAKLPHLPQRIRENLVQFAPWVSLLSGILGLSSLLMSGMLLSLVSLSLFSVPMMGIMWLSATLYIVINLIASILAILAYKPLSVRKKKGWTLVFSAAILMTILALFNMFAGSTSLGSILSPLLGLWLLFEVRGFYR